MKLLDRIDDLQKQIDGVNPELHLIRDQLSELADCVESLCVVSELVTYAVAKHSLAPQLATAATILGIDIPKRSEVLLERF